MVKGRSVRRARTGNGKGLRRTMKTPKDDFSAVPLKLSPAPPPAQEAPWNSLVVQTKVAVSNSSSFTFTGTQLLTAIRTQLELQTGQALSVRALRLAIWDLAAREMELRLTNPTISGTASTAPQLATDIKYPPRNGFTAIGFRYPKAISATPVSNTSTSYLCQGDIGVPYGITNVTTTTLVFRIHVLWRPTQNAPSIREPMFASSTKSRGEDTSNSLNDVIMSVSDMVVDPKTKPLVGRVRS